MTTITRLGFCQKCFEAKQPKTNQPFLVIGSSSNKLKLLYALHNGRTGMTPYFYKLCKVQDDKVYYQRVCGVCGIKKFEENDKNWYAIDESKWSNWKATSLKNWNALVLFKDTGFEI